MRVSSEKRSAPDDFIEMITKAPKGRTFVGKCDSCGITLIQKKIVIPRCPICEERLEYCEEMPEEPMQVPLSVQELVLLGDVYVWEERRAVVGSYFSKTPAPVLATILDVNKDDDFYRYGHNVRAWRRMPTDEEMEAAAWES